MNIPFINLAQFFLPLLFGITMIVEAFLIGILHKQITPLPSKILYWIGVGLIGKEKSTQRFTGNNTPENLKTYSIVVSFLGLCLIVSSFVYLNGILA
jgi:uncharacterized membrane protein YeaQ/YmgE (transglycosylase-associated protein family)